MSNPEMIDQIERVYWQDAYVTVGKIKPGKPAGLTMTIGMVAEEDDVFIYVSNYYDGISGKWASPWTAIPKGMVVKRETLQ